MLKICYKQIATIVRDIYNQNDFQQCGNIQDVHVLTIRDKN